MHRSTASKAVSARADRDNRGRLAGASLLPILACVFAALLLAGCAQAPTNLAAGNLAGGTKAKKADTAIAAPDADDVVADNNAQKPAKQKPAPSIWQTAEKLMGLESAALRAALGAPARIRDEETARIYQYVGGDCVLDLFLYRADGGYRVTYAEARSASAETKPVDACLKSLSPRIAANEQPST